MTTPTEKPSNPLWKFLIPAAVILTLVVGGLTLVKSQTAKQGIQVPANTKPGEFPDFTLTQFEGKSIKFSELGAKVVLLNFWATWCEACVTEMPSIVKLQHAYQDKGLKVLLVNVDEKPESVLPRSMKELGIDFQVFTDPNQKLSEIFDVHAIPLTMILDKDRNVLFEHNGEYDWDKDEFRSRLDGWLAK